MIVTINNNVIDSSVIRKFPTIKNRVEYNSSLIASEIDIELDNTDGNYSDNNPLGIFYANEWYDKLITVYDDVNNYYLWIGKIKNIIQDESQTTVTIKSYNHVWDLAETTCVIAKNDITPAEAILYILENCVYVTPEYIRYSGFYDAAAIQSNANVLIDIYYNQQDNKTCISVIQELMRISQCVLYYANNKFSLWQYRQYDGLIGNIVKNSYIIAGTFKTYYTQQVYNAYAIAYNYSGTVYYASGTKSGTDGTKKFIIPSEIINSTSPSDYKILIQSAAGAQWLGELAMNRYATMKKMCSFKMSDEVGELRANDQINLTHIGYYNEPIRITQIEYDSAGKIYNIEGEFLNLPINVVERDIVSPEAPHIVSAYPYYYSIIVKWDKNNEDDLLGYYLYFSAGSPGEWETLETSKEISPVNIKNPQQAADEKNYYLIYELPIGLYYIKMKAYDTSYNLSDDSNILTCELLEVYDVQENFYNCYGNIYTGIYLDINNSEGGHAPSEFILYDEYNYDVIHLECAAIYESFIFGVKGRTIDTITIRGSADDENDIKMQYAEYDPVTETIGSYSEMVSVVGQKIITINKTYVRIRVIFYSTRWSDTDSVYIFDIT